MRAHVMGCLSLVDVSGCEGLGVVGAFLDENFIVFSSASARHGLDYLYEVCYERVLLVSCFGRRFLFVMNDFRHS